MLLLLDIASVRSVGMLAQLPFFRSCQISRLPKRLRRCAANCGLANLGVALKPLGTSLNLTNCTSAEGRTDLKRRGRMAGRGKHAPQTGSDVWASFHFVVASKWIAGCETFQLDVVVFDLRIERRHFQI